MITVSIPSSGALDEDDCLPVWTYASGDFITDDLRAWERLGIGHRCETWLAWSSRLWSPVVVKLARPHQLSHPRALRSLEREVAALGGVAHPSLPRLVRAAIETPLPHVVLEYLDGSALDDELDEHRGLDDHSVALLGAQLLAALVPIHGRGLAHLDIKPENILIRDGRPVLVDFGSAREIGTRQPPGRPVGTLGWAAPEMEACLPISTTMDIFGVGKVLQACLVPAPGQTSSPGGQRLRGLIEEMIGDRPADRPTLEQAMLGLVGTLPAEQHPWPAWA